MTRKSVFHTSFFPSITKKRLIFFPLFFSSFPLLISTSQEGEGDTHERLVGSTSCLSPTHLLERVFPAACEHHDYATFSPCKNTD